MGQFESIQEVNGYGAGRMLEAPVYEQVTAVTLGRHCLQMLVRAGLPEDQPDGRVWMVDVAHDRDGLQAISRQLGDQAGRGLFHDALDQARGLLGGGVRLKHGNKTVDLAPPVEGQTLLGIPVLRVRLQQDTTPGRILMPDDKEPFKLTPPPEAPQPPPNRTWRQRLRLPKGSILKG